MTSRTRRMALLLVLSLSLCALLRVQSKKSTTDRIKQLDDPNPGIREQAVVALGAFGSRDQQVIAALAKRLKDARWEARTDAVDSLRRLANGSFSSPAADALIEGLRDRAPDSVRFVILKALESLNLADKMARHPGRPKDLQARINHVRSLQRTANGSYSSPAVDVLVDLLKDPTQDSLRGTIIDALERIDVLDQIARLPREGWFGVFACIDYWNDYWNEGYSQDFKQPFVSADKKSYGQEFTIDWTGNRGETMYYKLAQAPDSVRSKTAEKLLFEQCPYSTYGRKSLEGMSKLPDESLQGWEWRDPTKTRYCQVAKLGADSLWAIDALVDPPIPIVGANADPALTKRRIKAMKSPPRTDFRRNLEEFKVLTRGAKLCDVGLWVGRSYPNEQAQQPDGTFKMTYDLPDTSQVILTFKPDSHGATAGKGLPGLVAVRHVSSDPSGKKIVEEIPLK